jgi:hypothetical protein
MPGVVLDANARQRLPTGTDGERERGRALAGRQRYAPRPLTEGERWTVDALFELRRARFRPNSPALR